MTVTLGDACEHLNRKIGQWPDESTDTSVFAYTAGLGKTRQAIQRIMQLVQAGWKVIYLVPTHKLGQREVVEPLLEAGMPRDDIAVILGRSQYSHEYPDERMCAHHERAARLSRIGMNATRNLCKDDKGTTICSCLYQKQPRIGEYPVTVTAHHQIALAHLDEDDGPFVVILDEDPTPALLDVFYFNYAKLPAAMQRAADNERIDFATLDEVVRLTDGHWQAKKQAVAEADETAVNRHDKIARIGELILDDYYRTPEGDPDFLTAILKTTRNNPIQRVRTEYNRKFEREQVKAVSAKPMNKTWASSPRLVLDATASEDVLDRLIGPLEEFDEMTVEQPQLQIIMTASPITKSRFERYDADVEAQIEKFNALGEFEADRERLPSLLTFKSVHEGRIGTEGDCWHAVHHCYDIRGSNAFEESQSLVIAQQPLPNARAVEDEACAIYGGAHDLYLPGDYTKEKRIIGGREVDYLTHADPFVRNILYQKREAELIQAIHRLRAIRSDVPKRVYVCAPVDLGEGYEPTLVVSEKALFPTDRADPRWVLQNHAVLPLSRKANALEKGAWSRQRDSKTGSKSDALRLAELEPHLERVEVRTSGGHTTQALIDTTQPQRASLTFERLGIQDNRLTRR